MTKAIIVVLLLVAGGLVAVQRAKPTKPKAPLQITMPTRRPSLEKLQYAFPADSRTIFEHSDRFILYSIKPMPGGLSQENRFHGILLWAKLKSRIHVSKRR